MSKSITVQRKIFKIESKDIRHYTELKYRQENKKRKKKGEEPILFKDFEWCYTLDRKNSKNKDKIIALGESHTLRVLDKLLGRNENIKEEYDKCKECIQKIKQGLELDEEYKDKPIEYFYDKINEMQFQENYIMIVFNRKDDFKHINKHFRFNGKKFKRLYGTSGSIKNNTVIYIADEKINKDDELTLFEELKERLNNDRNEEVPLIPSKYEAYLSLNSSASTPINYKFKPEEILVVHDHVTNFNATATIINTCIGDKPNVETVEDYPIELINTDGCGLVDYEFANKISKDVTGKEYISSSYIIRNSYLKGCIFPFDIQDFIKQRKANPIVEDVWGRKIDCRKVKMILPTSVFKLWNCYDGIEDYLNKCEKNGHQFAVTKLVPEELESERTMNYQFLASLDLNKDEIHELIQPTIDEIHDVLKNDFRKAVLYTKGKYINKAKVDKLDADYFKAMMVDKRMLNDPHVRKNIYKMIETYINKCKVGKIKVHANFQIIAGSMIDFLEDIFKLEPSNLLKKGEFYSGYWNKQGVTEVVAMRAPSCTHANFRVINFKRNKELDHWYKYMQNCIVFNCWDSTAESLSGADKDKLLSLIDEV